VSRLTWVCAFIGLLSLPACAEPTVGPMTAAKRLESTPQTVEWVAPTAAPRPTRDAGSLDLFSDGAVSFLEGWAPGPDAVLLVVSGTRFTVINQARVDRPDAAAAAGDVRRSDVGFRMTLRARDGAMDKVCVLARGRDGVISRLGGSDPTLCPGD
jgi:hypothetical protein